MICCCSSNVNGRFAYHTLCVFQVEFAGIHSHTHTHTHTLTHTHIHTSLTCSIGDGGGVVSSLDDVWPMVQCFGKKWIGHSQDDLGTRETRIQHLHMHTHIHTPHTYMYTYINMFTQWSLKWLTVFVFWWCNS